MSETEFAYPGTFQRKLLAALIRRPEKMKGLIESNYFTDLCHQDIARLTIGIRDSPETKQVRLSKSTLVAMTRAFLGKRAKDLWPVYRRTIKKLYREKLIDLPILVREAIRFAKKCKYRDAINMAVKDVENEKYEDIGKRLNKLKGIGAENTNEALMYWNHYRSRDRWLEDREGIVGTWYFKLLDKAMGGGLAAGELGILLAGGKVGKSTLLARIAAGAMWYGKKVAIASGELSAFKYRKRIDSMLTGIPYTDLYRLRNRKAGTKKKMAHNRKLISGDIAIKAFPSGRAKIQDIEAWLDKLSDEGYVPDLLVVDYLALFKSNSHYEEKRLDLGQSAVDLRGLAAEKNIPAWTAAQTNRAALSKPMIGPADLAEDISLFFTLDFLVAVCQTEAEKGTPKEQREGKPEKCRIIMAAARDTARGAIISATIDRAKFIVRESGYWEPPKEVK